MTTTTFQLEQLTCPSCIKKIETALTKKEGIAEVKVSFTASKVKVNHYEMIVDAAGVGKVISGLGFHILSIK
ncbi:heavy-metal-associated domain-containing protein [Paenibacillus sp. CAU 1782]